MNKKKFTVSIGNYGTMVILHDQNLAVTTLFVESLTEEIKPQLIELFERNKSVPIYILLDNIDQNYKKKTYSAIPKSDLISLIKRDLNKEFPSDNPEMIKSYLISKDRASMRWDVLLVSSSDTKEVSGWIEFIMQLANKLLGIYMLPIEIYELSKSALNIATNELGLKRKSNITFFIVQNQVSGTRQVVFFDQNISFTRVINYDFEDPKFTSKFEQDIFRTNEYLKRLLPDLKIQDVNIFNIFSDKIIQKINSIQNKDLNFINYSPYQIASKLGISGSTSSPDEAFSDGLIANFFVNQKNKILRFRTPKIIYLEKVHLIIKLVSFLNIGLIFGILGIMVNIFISKDSYEENLSVIKLKKQAIEKNFENVKIIALDGDENKEGILQIDEIMDFGRIDDALSKVNNDVFEILSKFRFVKNSNALADNFEYGIKNYDPKIENNSVKISFSLSGKVLSTSGDVEDMFRKFDDLSLEAKTNFDKYEVKSSDLPKDIDFGKKYYSFPFSLKLNSK